MAHKSKYEGLKYLTGPQKTSSLKCSGFSWSVREVETLLSLFAVVLKLGSRSGIELGKTCISPQLPHSTTISTELPSSAQDSAWDPSPPVHNLLYRHSTHFVDTVDRFFDKTDYKTKIPETFKIVHAPFMSAPL